MPRPSDAARVAREILTRPDDRHHLYPLGKVAGLRLLRLCRVLDRFLEVGWLADGWERQGAPGVPPRRYYVLTDLGRREMPSLLVRIEA